MVCVGSEVQLVPARSGDKEVVVRLLEFNAYELSRFDGADVDRSGRFGYRYLDRYWTEPNRHPYLMRVNGCIAGLVLIRSGRPHRIAEFLVLPKYRRSGVGTMCAHAALALFSGEWELHQVPNNTPAIKFWRRSIPVAFDESVDTDGTTQRFRVPP
jgi:predicted acetyltransferase